MPLKLAYVFFAQGAEESGSFVCGAIFPAFEYELNVRFRNFARCDSPPQIRLDALGVTDKDDVMDAFGRCLSLKITAEQSGYLKAAQLFEALLRRIHAMGEGAPWRGEA